MKTIHIAALTGALLLSTIYAAPVTFSANGNFSNGPTLGGTVTIDTATGVVLSGDLAISGVPAHFTSIQSQTTGPSPSPFFTEVDFGNGQSTSNELGLLFKPASLVGYAGGQLCGSSPINCPDPGGILFYVTFYGTNTAGVTADIGIITSGALSTTTPEPSSLILMSAALVTFARKSIRRRPS